MPKCKKEIKSKVKPDKSENLKKEIEELKTMLQRERADFLNYKKRVEEEMFKSALFFESNTILQLFPIYQNIKRAINTYDNKHKDEWIKGIFNIYEIFEKQFKDMQIEIIGKKGEKFDANCHEAMMQVPGKNETIIEVFEEGFKYKNKVIKPAKVSVGNGQK